MKLTLTGFVLEQWTPLAPALHADLSGKTVLVTGANTGLGFEAAKHFAKMKPARLILACRSLEKGQKAAEKIAQDAGIAAEVRTVDHNDLASVVAFGEAMKDVSVDILVANAGIPQQKYATTSDGWEQILQVNHIATALVCIMLLPNLALAAQQNKSNSRLVIVSSSLHILAKFDEEVLSSPKILRKLSDAEYCTPKRMAERYNVSKMLNVFFTRALVDHLAPDIVIIPTSVNPGYCYSDIRRGFSFGLKAAMRIADLLMGRSTEEGARQLVWAALGPDGKDGPHVRHMRGAYVSTAAVAEPGDYVISKEGYEAQERVWRETLEYLEGISPAVKSITGKYLR